MNTLLKTTLFAAVFLGLYFTANAQINLSTKTIESTVDMVWEADSYVPPFYKGKALYTAGGDVTILAFPPESLGDPNTLSYTWKKNGEVQGSVSGIGKRTFTYTDTGFAISPLIVVEVSNKSTSAAGAFRLSPQTPVVRFYENKPLEGVSLEHALPKKLTQRVGEMTVEAYPYFFSVDTRHSDDLQYAWAANSQRLTEARGATIEIQNEEPQIIQLYLSLNNLDRVLQRASENTTITFE